MAELTQLLLATQDPNSRAQAEAKLKEVENASFPEYFTALASELARDDAPGVARQLSGLLLKNGLASTKDAARNRDLKARWCTLDEQRRNHVKECTTKALIAPDHDVGKAAAQVLGKIGSIEIPHGQWPGLVPLLLQHVTNQDARARRISLVCLCYLCEDLVPLCEEGVQLNADDVNKILTAVAQGMRDAENGIKLEATRAFYHAVALASQSFEKENERNFIMTVVIEACKTPDDAVQSEAFGCLVQIASWYYKYLLAYMPVIANLTLEVIKNCDPTKGERTAMGALEFWSTVCDCELDVTDDIANNVPGEKIIHHIIQQAIPHLVPLLLEVLVRGQADEDDDSWNLSQAAGVCLNLVANLTGDQCVDTVLPFIQQHFGNPDWKYREAAVLAYGSIMEGPSSEKMAPLVSNSFASLVQTMRDQNVAVRDTVAWSLGRIAQFHPSIVPVKNLTPVLVDALSDVPRVAEKICWTLQEIAENCTPASMGLDAPPTTALSEFFASIAEKLLVVSKRPDAAEKNLRTSAYNSLSTLIARSGNDCTPFLGKLVEEMLNHLGASFQVIDKECEIQSLICGVLMSLTMRLRQQILQYADAIMEGALKVMSAYVQVKGGAQVLHEEALLLVSSLAEVSGSNFSRYMTNFAPHLQVGLTNYEDVKVCVFTVSMIGTISNCLGSAMTQYSNSILELLYTHLKNDKVDRKIKSAIMPVFGDIALQIGGEFEKCLAPVLAVLEDAAGTSLPEDQRTNEDSVDYLIQLRVGVLEAYQGIIHGLKEGGKLAQFKEHVNPLLTFVIRCAVEGTDSTELMGATLKVLGDVIMAFQNELVVHLKTDAFAPCLQSLSNFARTGGQSAQNDLMRLQNLLQRYG